MSTAADRPARLQVPVKEAARLLSMCRATLYRMHKDGELTFNKVRGRTFVRMSELERVASLALTRGDTRGDT
jgi:excisionase family DNA binding protein